MIAPKCSVHGSDMKPGRKGGWFCSRKVGDGWCTERIAPEKPKADMSPTPAAVTDLVIVSYDIAARVLQGSAATVQEVSSYAIAIRNAIRAEQASQ